MLFLKLFQQRNIKVWGKRSIIKHLWLVKQYLNALLPTGP